jgi:hypothetical protein
MPQTTDRPSFIEKPLHEIRFPAETSVKNFDGDTPLKEWILSLVDFPETALPNQPDDTVVAKLLASGAHDAPSTLTQDTQRNNSMVRQTERRQSAQFCLPNAVAVIARGNIKSARPHSAAPLEIENSAWPDNCDSFPPARSSRSQPAPSSPL